VFHIATDDATIDRLYHGATLVHTAPALFRVGGPGALTCLQGLLTNDLDQPGSGSLVYGALLTPKGMIVLDLWSIRDEEGFTLIVPLSARQAAVDLLRKSLPPRLARVADLTGEATALWLLGGGVGLHTSAAGLGSLPEGGRAAALELAGQPIALASGPPAAWFRGCVVGGREAIATARRNLSAEGVVEGDEREAEAARVLAGWPALGSEIGEKTLPQEVRYDEIGGVSYTKGCYTGQETVARVHFRGHPNRELRGLVWDSDESLTGTTVTTEDRAVGEIGSVVETPHRRIGLAVLRREVEPGTPVTAGGRPAVVALLPFAAERLSA
jgi:folate-binding protein YgfZ